MIYIFDSSSLFSLQFYYPNQFPTFWEKFNNLVIKEEVLSVKEVFAEIEEKSTEKHVFEWCTVNKTIFKKSESNESNFMAEIFTVPRFREIVKPKDILKGKPVADPFVVASAKIRNGCVVTQEKFIEQPIDAPKIPNICKYFNIDCTNLEGFLIKEGWQF